MQARMKNPVMVLPSAMEALQMLANSVDDAGVPLVTQELVHLRVAQINGCSVCTDLHARGLRKHGEKDERIFALAAWRDTPYYTEAERAALGLAEAVTRIADRAEGVPDAVWSEAVRHFDERAMASLVISIGTINLFTRINAATRQVTGPWVEQYVR